MADGFVIEVFCGKAGLSRALRRKGFQVFSIDHKAVKGLPILVLDLNSESDCKIFEELLEQERVLYVHFAPPCGTASLARGIKLKHGRGPQPLRSLRYPMGLPRLNPRDRHRVFLANRLYKLTCKFVTELQLRGIAWSVENPASSLMWATDAFVKLMHRFRQPIVGICFHTCMFGAPRKKQTALWANFSELTVLQRQCDDSHVHAAWGLTPEGTFATAEECAYNSELCAHWAEAVFQYARRQGLRAAPGSLDQVVADDLHVVDKYNKAALGMLPRGNKLPPILTDFLDTITVRCLDYDFLQHAKPGARLPDNSIFPKGARLLGIQNEQVGSRSGMAEIGIPVDPLQYVSRACTLVHPEQMDVKLPETTLSAIQLCAEGMGVVLRRKRLEWTKGLLRLVLEYRQLEQQLVAERPKHLQPVLKDKKFGVMHAALEAVGYEDAGVAMEASSGFPLVGWMKRSGVFSAHVRPPELHVSSLEAMSASYNAKTLASVQESGDPDMDGEVWRATLAEVEDGTLEGPFDVSALPVGHIVSPRFGIRQGAKVRPIDNLSSSGINSTVGLPERLQVDTIDEVAAVIKRCMQEHGPRCKLVGRTYDLKRAYRQLGVHMDHFKFAWIAVWTPELQRVQLFRMRGLPFGGTASVASFLRMSRSLKELGIRGASLVWSSFFDDFVCVCRPEDVESTDMTVRYLFKVLGWRLSEDPDKDVGFSSVFSALGVEFDLSDLSSGVLKIGNTAKRRAELKLLVEQYLAADELSADHAESFKVSAHVCGGSDFWKVRETCSKGNSKACT